MTKQLRIKIYGDVIGVNFRYYAKQKADELGLVGWVRNLPDGSVEILAQGEKEILEKLLEWAREGPKFAQVDNVEVSWGEPAAAFERFEIKY